MYDRGIAVEERRYTSYVGGTATQETRCTFVIDGRDEGSGYMWYTGSVEARYNEYIWGTAGEEGCVSRMSTVQR